MKVLVADDEALARDLLRALLAQLPGVEVVADASDGQAAIDAAAACAPDLVFLDIDMPGRDGITAGQELARQGREVIFVTAHEAHAVEAFDMGAVDYLLKPVRRPRLVTAIERALRRFEARSVAQPVPAATHGDDGALWVPVRHGTVRLAIADIVRVEAAGDLVYLHAAQRAYLYRTTMAELEQRLAGSGLIRVHRSAFIRLERVTGTRRRGKVIELLLDDGTQVPVGPRFRTAALRHLRPPDAVTATPG